MTTSDPSRSATAARPTAGARFPEARPVRPPQRWHQLLLSCRPPSAAPFAPCCMAEGRNCNVRAAFVPRRRENALSRPGWRGGGPSGGQGERGGRQGERRRGQGERRRRRGRGRGRGRRRGRRRGGGPAAPVRVDGRGRAVRAVAARARGAGGGGSTWPGRPGPGGCRVAIGREPLIRRGSVRRGQGPAQARHRHGRDHQRGAGGWPGPGLAPTRARSGIARACLPRRQANPGSLGICGARR